MFAVSPAEGLAGATCNKKGDRSEEPEGIQRTCLVGKLCLTTAHCTKHLFLFQELLDKFSAEKFLLGCLTPIQDFWFVLLLPTSLRCLLPCTIRDGTGDQLNFHLTQHGCAYVFCHLIGIFKVQYLCSVWTVLSQSYIFHLNNLLLLSDSALTESPMRCKLGD